MTNLQKQEAQSAIINYCRAKGFDYQELAANEEIAVEYQVIRNMVNGNWDNIPNKVWQRVWTKVNIENFLKETYKTCDFQSVWNTCDSAKKNRLMLGITGDTGMGKSTALRAYSIKPNVFYRYIDGSVNHVNFLQGLLQEMGIQFCGTYHDMLKRVVTEFNSLSEPLLIVDEAGKLNDRMILMLHSLRDQTIFNAGIVLAGMPDFKNSLIKKRDRGVMGYSEFFRRIQQWQTLNGLSKAEITYVLEQNGITEKEEQQEFRKLTRFGDLDNAIKLHKTLNN